MKHLTVALAAALALVPRADAAEAKLVRYPHYRAGQITFTYLADVWVADENGRNLRRVTVHRARDVYPRFSPDGQWIAFSSDRNGNLDVFIVPAGGGLAKALTAHSADDTVVGWSPDSKRVLFASNRAEDFAPRLYTVGLEGGMPKSAGADMGIWADYSPDGGKLAINRHGQVYWRKYYRGANQTDITIMNVASKAFTRITDFNGLDSWPMWGRDGYIYFVSDREGNGLTNIWRISDSGGAAAQVTTFKAGDVRWPSISADGKVIMFEHDFGIWKLDVGNRAAAPITLEIAAETQENATEVRPFASEVDDYALEPSGRRIAFSIHGEVFTAPVEEGDLVQITDGPARDRDPSYSPDGKTVAYVSDRSGREEIYLASTDGAGAAQQITDLDALKLSLAWSPDSKALAYVSSDGKLRRYDVETRRTIELATSKYGNISAPAWSPDGQWIAYARPDQVRTGDVYLVPAAGGDERRATFDSYHDAAPRFAPNGRKLYFIRSEGFGGGGGFFGGSGQIYAVTLEREERDPDDPLEEREPGATDEQTTPAEGRARRAAAEPVKPIAVDWAGLKRRTRQVTRMPMPVTSYALAPDSQTLAFVTTEPAGLRTQPVIYAIRQDGRRLSRVTALGGGREDDDPPPTPPGGGFGGPGISGLTFARDGRSLFFREGRGVYSVPVSAGSPRGDGPPAAGTREAQRRRVNFNVKVRIDRPAEWAEMFGDAWRTMKYRFYDPKMHGKDWDAMKAKYAPLVAHVGDRQELLNVINEMIGELNASHTGAASPPASREGGVSTGYLGLDLEPDEQAGRYRVTHVYEEGPADKDWVKVSVGDYLLAIDGKPVKAGDEYWSLLNHRLNRKVEITLNNKPAEEGAWKTRIAPITQGAHNQLRYERWVRERRVMVDKLSNGRVGYLHIQAMNQPSLRRFEKELRENRHKEALVIDQRWNGGGNIDQELLGILVQRPYQIWQPRGTEPNPRPFSGFFGPKVVLQNWRSASNAEMFPAGFRALGLGKVIGTPTAGAVIGTGSYSLVDGSTVRTPGTGVFLADAQRTNMENFGVPPDIFVDNTPEDNLAGRDRQLEAGVQELLKELGTRTTTQQ
ncbi:MAG TPA: S41 family peptidase [Vicinamibacterales bacterium]|nr:S41 family peptidase [Vicinamibacterales bacterium]